jgi:hypothetical protein
MRLTQLHAVERGYDRGQLRTYLWQQRRIDRAVREPLLQIVGEIHEVAGQIATCGAGSRTRSDASASRSGLEAFRELGSCPRG